MKANSLIGKLLKWSPFLIVLVILMACAAYMIRGVIGLQGESHVGITKEEAQSLVVFPICMPTYIPQGINSKPKIKVISEVVSDAMARELLLTYESLASHKVEYEVSQWHKSYEDLNTADAEAETDGAKVSLLYWMIPHTFFFDWKYDAAKKETQMVANVNQTNETVWGLYEIVDPSEYRSTMTYWRRNHVEYRIVASLSADDITKVTLSMLECSTQSP